MKNEKALKSLIRELFEVNELHQEYQDNEIQFAIDSQRNGDTVILKIKLLEDRDRKEFEEWVNKLDDDLFQETWEALQAEDNLHSLDEAYKGKDYKEVIKKFKAKVREIASNRIKKLQVYL